MHSRVSIFLHNAGSSLEEQQRQKRFKIPNVQSLLRTTVPSLGEKSLFLPKIWTYICKNIYRDSWFIHI